MALTKIGKEGITGISNASDATFLTATSGEGVTLAGTLAVTGVHTVGNNAIYTSDGSAVTQNLVQGLAKHWVKFAPDAAADDSLNNSSITDTDTGRFTVTRTNNMGNTNYVGQVNGEWTHGSDSGLAINSGDNNTLTTSAYGCIFYNSSFATYDVDGMAALFHGDLA